MPAKPSPRRRVAVALLLVGSAGAGLWFVSARHTDGDGSDPTATSAAAATPAPAAPPPIARVREDVWYRLHPDARDAVGDMMDADDPNAHDPPQVDLGANGTMTRLPGRYRPVTVATRLDGEYVIDEVLAIPPDDASRSLP